MISKNTDRRQHSTAIQLRPTEQTGGLVEQQDWQTEEWLVWRLNGHGKSIQCVIGLLPNGFQGRYLCNGSLLYEYMFDSWTEAFSWACEKRNGFVSRGWIQAIPFHKAS